MKNYTWVVPFLTHEIKSSVLVIKGYSALAAEDKTNSQYERIICEEAKRIESTLEMLNQFYKVQSPRKRSKEVFDFKQIIKSVLELYQPIYPEVNFELKDTLDESFMLKGFKRDIEEVFRALAENTFRHTPSDGFVVWHLFVEKQQICLEAISHGAGMKNQIIDRVMSEKILDPEEAFGVGIGCCLIRELVQRNNGTVTMESDEQTYVKTVIKFTLNLD